MTYLDDALMWLGLALVVYGIAMLSIPGALIVAGSGLISLGILYGLGGKR